MHSITTSLLNNRNDAWLQLCAITYCGVCLTLGVSSTAYATIELPLFATCILLATITWLAALFISRHHTISMRTVLFWAIVFRVCMLPGFPVLEDDIYRYMWDGYMVATSGSAYGIPPELYYTMDLPAGIHKVLNLVSNPDIPTVYGPITEWFFGLGYLLAPGEIWPLKAVILIFDIGLLLLLTQWLSARRFLLLSWCPLMVMQFSLNAHIDILAIFFLIAALTTMLRHYPWWLPPLLIGLAVSCKIFALLAAPFLITQWRQGIVFALTVAIFYVPLLLTGNSEFDGLLVMSSQWIFNSPLYSVGYLLNGDALIRTINPILFVAGYILIVRRFASNHEIMSRATGCLYVYALLMICLPVVNAWYFAWVLIFAPLTRNYWPWVSATAVWLTLVIGINLRSDTLDLYEMPLGILTLEYMIIVAAVLCEFGVPWFRKWQGIRRSHNVTQT